MNGTDFNSLLDERLAKTKSVLASKATEYATDEDRLHNFKVAAAITGVTPAQALLGMWVKYVVSICDMVRSDMPYGVGQWDEKIGDAVNYLVLLEAIIHESPTLTIPKQKKEQGNA